MHAAANPYTDEQLRSMIVEGMPDAVILTDTEGVIRQWNRGAETLFGYAASEALGAPVELIIPEKLRRAHGDGFRRAVAAGHLKSEGKVLTTRADSKHGARLYVDFSFGLLKDGGGAVVGVFAVGRDATARYLEKRALDTPSAT
jgi:PAS domain S-box-containing protein